jgi:hypothetical protein
MPSNSTKILLLITFTHCFKCRGQEFVELHHRSHARVYGVVLNYQMDNFNFSSPEDEFLKAGVTIRVI